MRAGKPNETLQRPIQVDGDGRLVLDDLERLVDGVKVVGVSAMSNVLGTINPVRVIADVAHAAGAVVVADGAQLVPHLPVDVEALGADFLAFSGHKTMGPTGITLTSTSGNVIIQASAGTMQLSAVGSMTVQGGTTAVNGDASVAVTAPMVSIN